MMRSANPKICLIADVVLDVLARTTHDPAHQLEFRYTDSIATTLPDPSQGAVDADITVIHSDAYFHRYASEQVVATLQRVLDFSQEYSGKIMLSNAFCFTHESASKLTSPGQLFQFFSEHGALLNDLQAADNITWLDFTKLVQRIGVDQAYNFSLGLLYQMPYTKPLIELLAREIHEAARFLSHPEKKVIVLDCDNTLWHGVLGEDGIDKTPCDQSAHGILHLHFQNFLAQKKREGFLLALCSKNDESLVKEKFKQEEMPLVWRDFAVRRIGYSAKVEGLTELASELNLGLDGFVFVDDSEFELEAVRHLLPEVKTLRFPNAFNQLLDLMDDYAFKRKAVLPEDGTRNEYYQTEQRRTRLRKSMPSLQNYLATLDIKLDLQVNREAHLRRVAQLSEKTNQFNFNKKPFSVRDLQNFIRQGGLVYSLSVRDKFGTYGVVGAAFVRVAGVDVTLLNFLLSCRALGRTIENDFYRMVLRDLEQRALNLVEVRFCASERNAPAREFYEKYCLQEKNNATENTKHLPVGHGA